MLYFGCWGGTGHFLRDANGRLIAHGDHPWPDRIDAGLCPGPRDRYGDVRAEHQVEGEAALHHLAGWTALAFWDRSVDRRGGSNSVFLTSGTFAAGQMIEMARREFPAVWERFRFDVTVDGSNAPA